MSAGRHLKPTEQKLPTILPWYGGKHRMADWIVDLLPRVVPGQIYVEPFGGMAAVLRARPRARTEVFNDLDRWVVNWWRVVRDQPDRLAHMMAHSPHSRYEYHEHRSFLASLTRDILTADEDTRIAAAHSWSVCIAQGHSPIVDGGFGVSSELRRRAGDWWHESINLLKERFSGVLLEHYPALDLLERYSDETTAVIYCDPPYTQGGDRYRVQFTPNERQRLVVMTTGAAAKVAISGYQDCFPELDSASGWETRTKIVSTQLAAGRKLHDSHRVEFLWTNYNPQEAQAALWDDRT